MNDESTLEDLEIVAGHVWSAVGGVDDGRVSVRQVDPKRFGVEIAAASQVTWALGEEGDTRQATLATLRPFKPMDLMVVDRLVDPAGTASTIILGATRVRGVDIGGVQQFTAKTPVNSAVFNVAGAPRPKIRFDTVQTSPNLTADLDYVGLAIPASAVFTSDLVFGGVAVKR